MSSTTPKGKPRTARLKGPYNVTVSIANTMLEGELQNNILEAATRLGYEHYHTHNSFRSDPGFPDLVLARIAFNNRPEWPKRLIFAELKRQNKNPTPAQQMWINLLKENGMEVYVWRPSDWLDDTILNILRGK